MEIEEIKKRLEKDIQFLTDYRGFILAGAPKFKTLFGRDSLFVSWQLLNYDPEIAANTLKILASLQAREFDAERETEPGKILHEMWGGSHSITAKFMLDRVPYPYYGSVDSTPLFIIVAGKYYEATKDIALIKRIWKNIVRAKDWILTYGDANQDGFLDFDRKNPQGPLNQSWKDGGQSPQFGRRPIAMVEVQGYKYAALILFNKLAESVGVSGRIEQSHLDNFREKFAQEFYWPEENFFYLAIDGEGKKYKSVASNPGHLLFTNLVTPEHKKFIVNRLFREDLWTPHGIRTHSMKNEDFDAFSYQLGSVWPFDNWVIAEGLRISGFQKEYFLIKRALTSAFEALGSLPEFYVVTVDGKLERFKQANPLQAWSSAALLNMLL